jgi:hypothetical protein
MRFSSFNLVLPSNPWAPDEPYKILRILVSNPPRYSNLMLFRELDEHAQYPFV